MNEEALLELADAAGIRVSFCKRFPFLKRLSVEEIMNGKELGQLRRNYPMLMRLVEGVGNDEV